MKKTLLSVAVVLCTIGANAQTESWYVNNEDGTLKAEYTANSDPTQMSVVEFETKSVKGTHTSGPVAGYADGEILPLETTYDNSWGNISKKDLSADGSVAPFYYVQGKGNPVDISKVTFEEIMTDDVPTGVYRAYWGDAYYSPDGTAGLPTNGTYVTFVARAEGTLKIAAWINKGNRDVYIAKASDGTALSIGTDVTVSGYINGQNNDVPEGDPLAGYPMYQENIPTKGTEGSDAYVLGEGNQACWVYLTFKVVPGETYYVFNKSTQIGFSGYEFTPDGESGINDITVEELNDPNAPVYNLAGQRVDKNAKGILIQNGKKFIRK